MKNNKSIFKTILRFLSLKKKNIIFIIFLSFISGIFDAISLASLYPVLNIISGTQIDSSAGNLSLLDSFTSWISNNQIMSPINLAVSLLIGFTLLKLFSSYFAEVLGKYSQFSIRILLQKKIFDILINNDYQRVVLESKGDLLYKLQVAPTNAEKLLAMVPQMIDGLIRLVLTVGLLMLISPKYTFYSIIIFLLYFIISERIFKKISYKTGQERTKIVSKMTEISLNMLKGIISIRVFGTNKYWIKNFNNQCDRFLKAAFKNEYILPMPSKLLELLIIISIAITAATISNAETMLITVLPSLGVYALAYLRMIPNLRIIGISMMRLGEFAPFAEEIFEKIDSIGSGNNNFLGQKTYNEFNSLELRNVSFNYEKSSDQILNNVSNNISKGTFVGILGESGSGKTTLLNLINGILKPTKGNVLINNNNIFLYKKKDISKIFGYVGQEPFLYNDTIKNNIIFGRKNIDEDLIVSVLKKAELYDYIQKLPGKMDYKISDDGMNFSGGQRQRMMLARAFVGQPSILLLDEATSALDHKTENRILKTILNYINKENKTVIFVTHRKIALRNTDKIFFMKDGTINKIYKKGTSEFSDFISSV